MDTAAIRTKFRGDYVADERSFVMAVPDFNFQMRRDAPAIGAWDRSVLTSNNRTSEDWAFPYGEPRNVEPHAY